MSIEAGSFPSLIFPVHLEQVARIGIEVKGGSYRLEGGEWRLPGVGRQELHSPSPALPDMEPGQDIAYQASAAKAHVLSGG